MAGGSGGGGGGRSVNKVALAICGVGVAGLIIFFNPPGGDDDPSGDDEPQPTAASIVERPTTAPTVPAATTRAVQSAPPARPPGLQVGPDEAVLTLIAYGLPARFSPTLEGSNDTLRGEFREQCTPDIQYPNPCIFDYVVKKGTNVTIHAGDSRAGLWPVLKSVRGPGCTLDGGDGRELSCTVTVGADMSFEAKYFGSQSVDSEYIYPACPKNRGNSPQGWMSRCQ